MRITPVKLVITTILGLFTAPLAAEAQQSKSTARRVMDRRALVSAIALSLLAAPLAAAAQQGKVFLLGYLVHGTVSGPRAPHLPSSTAPADKAFLDGMRQLGYVYGKHFIIETRSAQGTLDRLPGLATELVALKVDAIVVGSTPQALAAKHATSTIPIVMTTPGDPVGDGLVASLPRPGGNLTGLTLAVVELSGKRPEILKEALPDLRRVAMLTDPGFGQNARGLAETQAAAKRLGLQVQPVEVREPSELDMGFLAARRSRADGVVVQSHSLYFVHRRRIADLAIGYRLPTIFSQREHIDVGA